MRSWYQWSRPSTIVDVVAAAAHDDDVLDRRRVGDGLVGRRLEREHLAAAVAAVGGDQHLGLGVVDAVGERVGARTRRTPRCAAAPMRAQASIATAASGIIGM